MCLQALRKKGLAQADKKAGRIAAEGLLAQYVHAGSRSPLLLLLPMCLLTSLQSLLPHVIETWLLPPVMHFQHSGPAQCFSLHIPLTYAPGALVSHEISHVPLWTPLAALGCYHQPVMFTVTHLHCVISVTAVSALLMCTTQMPVPNIVQQALRYTGCKLPSWQGDWCPCANLCVLVAGIWNAGVISIRLL